MKANEAEALLREFMAFLAAKGVLQETVAVAEPVQLVPVVASVLAEEAQSASGVTPTVRQTIDVKTAAQMMGVSMGTVYTLVRENQIPHVRVRQRVLFSRSVIEAWIRGEQEVKQA